MPKTEDKMATYIEQLDEIVRIAIDEGEDPRDFLAEVRSSWTRRLIEMKFEAFSIFDSAREGIKAKLINYDIMED
jgi:hypothetical protein